MTRAGTHTRLGARTVAVAVGVLVVVGLAGALAGCNRTTGRTASGSAPTPPGAASRTVIVHTKDGARQAIVVHPSSAPTHPALVVMLHGGFGNDRQAEDSYGWDAEATREGFVVAYPNGIKASWNVGRCCGPAQARGVDDVGFLHTLVDQLAASDGIDKHRVYAVGMSNGAMMTYTWACDDPGELAGIGPVAGSLLTDCPSARPITVIAVHGSADQNVPINGGVGAKSRTGVANPPLTQTLAPFLAADRCGTDATVTTAAPVVTSTWRCASPEAVMTRVVQGAGHQWPGSYERTKAVYRAFGIDPPSTAFSATDFLWQQLRSAHT